MFSKQYIETKRALLTKWWAALVLCKKALQLAICATAELWRFSIKALDVFLVLLQRAIGHENSSLGRGEGGANIKDYACLLGVIGGEGVAKNIGNTAQNLALLHEVTAVNMV